jgi:hypothetical protein
MADGGERIQRLVPAQRRPHPRRDGPPPSAQALAHGGIDTLIARAAARQPTATKIVTRQRDNCYFLTSHGSSDASLDTPLYPLELRDLSASDLREYLDEAGIQWRIIVVSACYSGSFIDPLRNARSLVITASASDRNSFGCSDERDLTYFGEEFLQSQLSRSADLIEAFNITALNINAKEVSEGLTPSKRQIFVGSLIRDRLDSLVRRGGTSGRDNDETPP